MLLKFVKDDAGAVTVDWVLLTAATVGFCIAAYTLLFDEAFTLSTTTSDAILAEID